MENGICFKFDVRKPCSDGFVCLGRALTFPNPNHQIATGVQPSAFGGFGTHAEGTTIQSVVSRLHLQRETCTNGHGKTTSVIPLIIFVFGEFSGPCSHHAVALLHLSSLANCTGATIKSVMVQVARCTGCSSKLCRLFGTFWIGSVHIHNGCGHPLN